MNSGGSGEGSKADNHPYPADRHDSSTCALQQDEEKAARAHQPACIHALPYPCVITLQVTTPSMFIASSCESRKWMLLDTIDIFRPLIRWSRALMVL